MAQIHRGVPIPLLAQVAGNDIVVRGQAPDRPWKVLDPTITVAASALRILAFLYLIFAAFNARGETHLTKGEDLRNYPDPDSVTWVEIRGDHTHFVKEFPKEISRFKNLRKLDIIDSQIGNFEFDFSVLPQLESLRLENCGLDAIPDSIFQMKSLKSLNLGDNRIKIIPRQLGALKKLAYLWLSSNDIEKIEVDLSSMGSLFTVDLSYNELTGIPEAVLHAPGLEFLCLKSNPIRAIPDDIRNLKRLRKLDLAGTRISTLPLALKECSGIEAILIADTPLARDEKAMAGMDEWLKRVTARFYIGGGELPDSVTNTEITVAVAGRRPSLQKCVAEQQARAGRAGGMLIMGWDIHTHGWARNVRCLSPEFCDQPLVSCIGSVLEGIRFPRSQSGRSGVEFPFKF